MSSDGGSAHASYKYQTLDHTTQQIRLIHLLKPSSFDDPINVEINIFDLSKAPPFTALSYVWRPPDPAYEIHVQDQTSEITKLKVRENLFDFLFVFREQQEKHRSDKYFWIDQLSIDQSTTLERNHQVQMMSEIFKKATSVVAWLGFEALPMHIERRQAIREAQGRPRHEWVDAIKIGLHQNYFQRLWIVQELLLAKRIRMLFEFRWLLEVDTKLRWPENISDALETLMDDSHVARPIFHRLGAWKYTLLPSIEHRLHGLLLDFMTRGCENPRDRIYALQGILHPGDRVAVDYAKSTQQVFADLCNHLYNGVYKRYYFSLAHHQKRRETNEHTRTLYRLADLMCFNEAEILALRRILRYRLQRLSDLCYVEGDQWPGALVGFEQADEVVPQSKRWWFEIWSTRQYFESKQPESDPEAVERRRFEAWQNEIEEEYRINDSQTLWYDEPVYPRDSYV
ncbi:heterokaryon incompatibility protein-domain-containing protein [Paraphoma chrysanthemicola]|nr:heterokaryon incompatibility protein-domain-containing protein [Paraphoma chrysanthemicola]